MQRKRPKLVVTSSFDRLDAQLVNGERLHPGWRWIPIPFSEPMELRGHVHYIGPEPTVELTFEDGSRLKCNQESRLLTLHGAARASELAPGVVVPLFRFERGGLRSLSLRDLGLLPGLVPQLGRRRTWTPGGLWKVLRKSQWYPYSSFSPDVVQYHRLIAIRRMDAEDAVAVTCPLYLYISEGGVICHGHPPML